MLSGHSLFATPQESVSNKERNACCVTTPLLVLEEAVGEGKEDHGVEHEAKLGGDTAVCSLHAEDGLGNVVRHQFEGCRRGDDYEQQGREQGGLQGLRHHGMM